MKLTNNIIALVMAALILTGVALPSLGAAFPELNGPSEVPLTYLTGDALDDMTMTLKTDGGHVSVVSATWTGTIMVNAIIVYTDKGSVYTDGTGIYSAFGNAVKTYAQLTVSLDSGTISIGTDSYPVTYAYWPWTNGDFGSYANGTVTDPIAAVGSFAGVAVSGSGTSLTTNTSDYLFETVLETDDRKSIGFVPGEYTPPNPVSSQKQMQEKPGISLDVMENLEETTLDVSDKFDSSKVDLGEFNKGEIIVIPEIPSAGIQAVGNATSGTTGNCTWRIEGDTLYIDGTGVTGDYPDSATAATAPWGDTIRVAYIGEGVTTLGFNTFNHCTLLEEVYLPSTLTNLKSNSFRGCGLTHIDLPEGLLTLNYGTFRGSALESLICPESLTLFGQQAIEYCPNLTELYIPAGATTIYSQAGTKFYALDGTYSNTPTAGSHYYGSSWREMNKTVTVEDGDLETAITYQGATLMSATTETVHIPYTVTYGGTDYSVKSIADGAVSGPSVRYVVIPQTVDSISPTAITSPSVKEILNLSETDVTSGSARIATELPTIANIADATTDNSFGFYSMLVGMVVVVCLLGMSIKLLPKRRDDWE